MQGSVPFRSAAEYWVPAFRGDDVRGKGMLCNRFRQKRSSLIVSQCKRAEILEHQHGAGPILALV